MKALGLKSELSALESRRIFGPGLLADNYHRIKLRMQFMSNSKSKMLSKLAALAVISAVTVVTAGFLMQLPAHAQQVPQLAAQDQMQLAAQDTQSPSFADVYKAVPAFTLNVDVNAPGQSTITVKEGEYFRLKLGPVEKPGEFWSLDTISPLAPGSSFYSGPDDNDKEPGVKFYLHGKGTYTATFRRGPLALTAKQLRGEEPVPYSRIFQLTIVVE